MGVYQLSTGFVSLRGVNKYFDQVHAVANLDLDVKAGEFFSMLGPSGSGKTTVLRLIAGFETASSGRVVIESQDVTDLAPFDRPVNTVFQDYALFPHMSIQENVEYGLRTRKVPKAERAKQALEAIDSVKLSHLSQRLPHQLSGGQRQRIGIARALYSNPKILVLDEATSALDAETESAITGMLKELHGQVTIISIAHRLSTVMHSDLVLFLRDGKLAGSGKFEDLVQHHPDLAHQAELLGIDVDAKENN